jgi:Homeodomain-like domain
LDPRVRARILGLHAEDPSLSTRKIAAMVGCSRETVRLLVRSAHQSPLSESPTSQAVTPTLVSAGGSVAWAAAAARATSEADHAKFDTYRGAAYERPGVMFWTFP